MQAFILVAVLIFQLQTTHAKFNLRKIYEFFSKKIRHEDNYKFSYQNCGPASDPGNYFCSVTFQIQE